MFVLVYTVEILIHGTASLKEKRFALRSIKDRAKNRFNISIAEIDYTDKWQRTVIGVSMVAINRDVIEKTVNNLEMLIEEKGEMQIINTTKEIL